MSTSFSFRACVALIPIESKTHAVRRHKGRPRAECGESGDQTPASLALAGILRQGVRAATLIYHPSTEMLTLTHRSHAQDEPPCAWRGKFPN